ncbi:MAG: hypothetical protein AB7S38_29820 [Vulcanimicrobiota bacterium]
MRPFLTCLLLLTLPCWATPPLVSKAQLFKGSEGPTEIGFDKAGRAYVLYGRQGYIDVYNSDGHRLERRGSKATDREAPDEIRVVSQWVGRMAKSLLLAEDPRQGQLEWVLIPEDDRIDVLRLTDCPTELSGLGAIARDLAGRIFVYHEQTHTIYVFGGTTGKFQSKLSLAGNGRRVLQFAVDSRHNYYLLGLNGLDVFGPDGSPAYNFPGVQAFYLTGADRLAAGGDGWIRRYRPGGSLELDLDAPREGKGKTVSAISLDDEENITIYYRDPVEGSGSIVLLKPDGTFKQDFVQPIRIPSSPDPGFRLDYQSRLHVWNQQRHKSLKFHPGGKVERNLSYVPTPDPKGLMVAATDMAVSPDGTVWIADPSNFRLQRFDYDQGGWLKPITVGIRDGAKRAHPRHLAVDGKGYLLCVVYPPDNRGQIVLHRRDPSGKLLGQQDLGPASQDSVVKVAVSPNGDFFVYNSSGDSGAPQLKRFTARGGEIATVGGSDKNFHLPNKFTSRVALSVDQDLLPWHGGLLIPYYGQFLVLSDRLQVRELIDFKAPREFVTPEFGGSTIYKNTLYLTDISNRCVHKIPLPQ